MCNKKNKNKLILLFIIIMCMALSSCKNGFITFNDLDENYVENKEKTDNDDEYNNEYDQTKELNNSDKNSENSELIKTEYKIKELFYVKNNSAYVMFDSKEYKICEMPEDISEIYHDEDIYYSEKDDIYYAFLKYTRDNKHKLYAIKNDNGNVKINLLLQGTVWNDEKLEYLYRDYDKLYFSVYEIDKNNNQEKTTGSIVEIHDGKVNYLYKNIKINNKKDDMLYYSKNIDTVFYISLNDDDTTYTIHSIKNGEDKIIYEKAYLMVANSLRVIATVDGIYYNLLNDEGIGGIAFYDGEEHTLTKDIYIREIKKTTSNNMFYLITNTHKKINLNDYIDSSSYPNSVLKELDGVDTTKMNIRTQDLFAVCKKDLKLVGENVNIKYDYNIRVQDDYIFFYTLKNNFKNKNEKIRYVEFKDSLKDNKYDKDRNFVDQIDRYFNDFLYDKNEYAFIYKGFEGTRLNFEDEPLKGMNNYLIDGDDLYYVTPDTGKFYAGNIVFNEVSNLKTKSKEEKFNKLIIASNKLFLDKRYSLNNYYGEATYDWYVYDDNKLKEISADENNDIRVCDDLDNNIYVLNTEKGLYLYDLKNNKTDLIIPNNNDEKINILYQIKKITDNKNEYIYNKNIKENFYLNNPDEYIKLLKENKINETKTIENENADNEENIDIKNDNIIKVKEYKSLSNDYIEGSKKYKVDKDKKKSYDDVVFYYKWSKEGKDYEFYANLNKDGALNKIHITDFKKDKLDYDEPRYIFYDELKDMYYYCLVKKIKDDYENLEYNIYEMSIKNDNTIESKLKIKQVLSEKENEVVDYLSQRLGLMYLGSIGKNDIYITGARNIYAYDGKSFISIGNTKEFKLDEIDKYIAINSYENKLYYLDYKTLYEVDNKLNKKVISENVKSFMSLQDELLYATNFVYRYQDGKKDRLYEIFDEVRFIGHHNSNKCYVLISHKNTKRIKDKFEFAPSNANEEMKKTWEQVKDKNTYYSYGGNSFHIYKDGEFVKLIDECKLIRDYDNKYIESLIDNPLLVATYESDEKINFNNYYNSLDKDKKDNLIDEILEYGYEKYIVYVDEYNLTLMDANEIFKNKNTYTIVVNLKNLEVEDKKISFTYDTEKYYIDLNNNDMKNVSNDINDESDENAKKEVNNAKFKLSKNDEELPIVKMGYYLR